eukprot:TRINITY_DN7986_c0_g1_i1.p1 TRINITY_DN7986_c0_g1~~TRINITY_DN7986_c0_g1_i1.p1  ORF type:complete len:381 (-),score=78.50 TRINITY_DN7986_c0_g1_i1:199-1263(-)
MGVCNSTNQTAVEKEERTKARQIESQLKQDRKEYDSEVKLLLLGAGESGKSTIAKQMKNIYLDGFTADERLQYKEIIYSNIVSSMKTLIEACPKYGCNIEKAAEEPAQRIMALNTYPFEVTPEIGRDIKALWADPGIKMAFDQSAKFQLLDSAAYFFNDIDRISAKDYNPDVQDVLRARSKTTGITETEFEVDSTKFRMVDVGGQRSERKKWIHCFESVTAVIFCVAMSEYDLKLYEDESVNRMHESIKLFDEICNSKWFEAVSIILFLNKSDIFREKIKRVDLKVCFDEYKGGLDFDKASAFITQKFISLNKRPDAKQIYPHITCATDTQNIKFVFNAVKNIILHKALEGSGF